MFKEINVCALQGYFVYLGHFHLHQQGERGVDKASTRFTH